jgi:pimeloyl-ACP methyl ester carboxylesterase
VSVSVAALALAFAPSLWRFTVAIMLLLQLTAAPLPAAVERLLLHPVSSELLTLPTSSAQVRARRYRPISASAPPHILLLHGVHALGIDEPRLVALARALASTGLDVLTPELTTLTHYEVSETVVSDISAIARSWAREQHTAEVGVIGISFAGGLSLMAAAAQGGRAPIGVVLSIGAHEDLTRVCDFYAGRYVRGPESEAVSVAPHPYGPRVLLRGALPRLFSAADLPRAAQALDTYLHDRPKSARELAAGLSPAGREVARVLLDQRPSEMLSGWLLEECQAHRPQLLAASPTGHLRGLQVPVLLLHGTDDPVVPSIETRYLARDVPPELLRGVLVTDLLRHAELKERPDAGQVYRFARFIGRLLALAGSTRSR